MLTRLFNLTFLCFVGIHYGPVIALPATILLVAAEKAFAWTAELVQGI